MTACGTTAAAGGLREQILSAAQACFHKRGFKATTMNAIARQAGGDCQVIFPRFA